MAKDRRVRRELEHDEEESSVWKPQYSIEQRKRFWEHGLNPITGMPPIHAKIDDMRSLPGLEIPLSQAKCNGATIF
jgi:hypothetical protein